MRLRSCSRSVPHQWGSAAGSSAEIMICASGSMVENSCMKPARAVSRTASIAPSSRASPVMTAVHWRGIALCLSPPKMEWTPYSRESPSASRKCAMSLIALPRFSTMLRPECPPWRPVTWTLKTGASLPRDRGRAQTMSESPPPAQPTKRTPSSSESMLISFRAARKPGFSAIAPVRPVSSSTVKRSSRGPWVTSGSVAIAMAIARPMPLSAPRVVPSALSQSPSR